MFRLQGRTGLLIITLAGAACAQKAFANELTAVAKPNNISIDAAKYVEHHDQNKYTWNLGNFAIGSDRILQTTLGPGIHTVSLLTEKNAKTVAFTIRVRDNLPPAAVIKVLQLGEEGVGNVSVTAEGSLDPEEQSNISYEWFVDGAMVSTNMAATLSINGGEHKVSLVVKDSLNATAFAATKIDIPNVKPYVLLPMIRSMVAGGPQEFTATGGDALGGVTFEWIDPKGNPLDHCNNATGVCKLTITQPGEYNYRVKVRDDEDTESSVSLPINVTAD